MLNVRPLIPLVVPCPVLLFQHGATLFVNVHDFAVDGWKGWAESKLNIFLNLIIITVDRLGDANTISSHCTGYWGSSPAWPCDCRLEINSKYFNTFYKLTFDMINNVNRVNGGKRWNGACHRLPNGDAIGPHVWLLRIILLFDCFNLKLILKF